MSKEVKWEKPTKRQAGYYSCTYGIDDDIVPGAPKRKKACAAMPVVAVIPSDGVGRCAKHAPKKGAK
jgi:hypothetical protein